MIYDTGDFALAAGNRIGCYYQSDQSKDLEDCSGSLGQRFLAASASDLPAIQQQSSENLSGNWRASSELPVSH